VEGGYFFLKTVVSRLSAGREEEGGPDYDYETVGKKGGNQKWIEETVHLNQKGAETDAAKISRLPGKKKN